LSWKKGHEADVVVVVVLVTENKQRQSTEENST